MTTGDEGEKDQERPGTPAHAQLSRLREEIARIDRSLIELIAERVRLAREVGVTKRAAGLPTQDPAREAAVIRQAAEAAREAGLLDDDIRNIFWQVIGLSRRAQLEGE
jgi:chorismate mutase